MQETNKGVVGAIIVAMIHKEMFSDIKDRKERREEIEKAATCIGKAFE